MEMEMEMELAGGEPQETMQGRSATFTNYSRIFRNDNNNNNNNKDKVF